MKAWIDDMTGRLGLLPGTSHALQLCLEEAVTNVISHAFEPDTVHDVHIALWRDDTALHAEVADDGRSFDPLSHALPAPPADLPSVPVGGLGIKLMRSFAERMAYRRCGAINRLTLSFSGFTDHQPRSRPIVDPTAAAYLGDMSKQRDTEPAAEQEDAKRPPSKPMPKEIGGPAGPEPTRYGDWEVNGRCSDF